MCRTSSCSRHQPCRTACRSRAATSSWQASTTRCGSIAIFASTFFTSVWLWLYAVSVPFSRLMVRMGGGVGFLLKVTDVEHHPFRSMGFTSVVLLSLIFLMGLPLVLLG